MSRPEIEKFDVIRRLIRKEINGGAAAGLLRRSTRQVRRLKGKVIKKGAAGLIHGNRGKAGHHRVPEQERKKIVALLNKRYPDFGPTFAAEKLKETHAIDRDPNTIRAIMIAEELWKPRSKKKPPEHRQWRERKSAYGEMEQFDGSYEHWLEDRGGTGELCLLASIDDATSQVTQAVFEDHEGVFPVFRFWDKYIRTHGKPRAIYLDKFSTYHMNHPFAKDNPDTLTQFQRAMRELHVEVIPANSPQAKGRIERLFETLQDRLIKELRLARVSTVEEANEFLNTYLPKFNAQFSVVPRLTANLHQPLPAKEQTKLGSILSRHTERIIQNDFTFSFQNQWYQLTKCQPLTICKKDKVVVEARTDHTVHIRLRGKYLNYRILPARPIKATPPWIIAKTSAQVNASKVHIPPANHPWRQATNATALKQLTTPG